MQRKYKFIVWGIVLIVLGWYLFYFSGVPGYLSNTKKFNLLIYKNNLKAIKTMVYWYHSEYDVVPRQLDESYMIAYGESSKYLYCNDCKLSLRLSNPTLKNILLFPAFPLAVECVSQKIKYSYIYDEAEKTYKVTLESPFKNKAEFSKLTFEVSDKDHESQK